MTLSPKTIFLIVCIVIALAIVGYVLHLRHTAATLQTEVQSAKDENKRLENKTEGLKILVNTKTTAEEIKNDKQKADMQASNSNISNANFHNARQRDSNESTGNFTEARKQFCAEFCEDSQCDDLRDAGECTVEP